MKVIAITPIREGVSQSTGNNWKAMDVVLEEVAEVAFPDSIVASINGPAIDHWTSKVGDVLMVDIGFRAHEYEGRYFNNARLRNWAPVQNI